MVDRHDAQYKSGLFSQMLRQREDKVLRGVIEDYDGELRFERLDELMISEAAWSHLKAEGIAPELVFAHPCLLEQHPQTSQYYRGMALLSQKQVSQLSASVSSWEDGSRKRTVPYASCVKVARLTDEMQTRLKKMGITMVFALDDLASEGPKWDAFVRELFHHTIRIT